MSIMGDSATDFARDLKIINNHCYTFVIRQINIHSDVLGRCEEKWSRNS